MDYFIIITLLLTIIVLLIIYTLRAQHINLEREQHAYRNGYTTAKQEFSDNDAMPPDEQLRRISKLRDEQAISWSEYNDLYALIRKKYYE